MSRVARTWQTALAALGVVLFAVGLGTVATTTAAWTDPAVVTLQASTGQWAPAPSTTPADSVITKGNDATSILSTQWSIAATPADAGFCVEVLITGTQATESAWELHVDTSKAPFYGGGHVWAGPANADLSYPSSLPGILVVRGVTSPGNSWNSGWNNALLAMGQQLTLKLCASNSPIAPPGPSSWYSVQLSEPIWSDSRACVVLTVTGKVTDLVANPFYFGWTAHVDLTAAKEMVAAHGMVLNWVEWTPWQSDGYQYFLTPGDGQDIADTYQLTSGRRTAIRGTGVTTVTVCVHGKNS